MVDFIHNLLTIAKYSSCLIHRVYYIIIHELPQEPTQAATSPIACLLLFTPCTTAEPKQYLILYFKADVDLP